MIRVAVCDILLRRAAEEYIDEQRTIGIVTWKRKIGYDIVLGKHITCGEAHSQAESSPERGLRSIAHSLAVQ